MDGQIQIFASHKPKKSETNRLRYLVKFISTWFQGRFTDCHPLDVTGDSSRQQKQVNSSHPTWYFKFILLAKIKANSRLTKTTKVQACENLPLCRISRASTWMNSAPQFWNRRSLWWVTQVIAHQMLSFTPTVYFQSEASSVLISLLTNVHEFLGELSSLAESNARSNAANIQDSCMAKELIEKLAEYVEQVHVEIPAMAECKLSWRNRHTQ